MTQTKFVPRKEQVELETPFGLALVNDWRGPHQGDTAAVVSFDTAVINRKAYQNVSVYMRTRTWALEGAARHWWDSSSSYLTPNAQRKLIEYLNEQEQLRDYLEPLPRDEERAMSRRTFKRRLLSSLGQAQAETDVMDDEVREVLTELLNAQNAGQSFKDQWMKPEGR